MRVIEPNRLLRLLSLLPLVGLAGLVACAGESASSAPAATPATPTTPSVDSATTPAASGGGTATLMPSGSAGSQKAERRTSASWTACHNNTAKADPSGDPVAQVEVMAQACASTTGLHKLQSFKGTQAASNPPQSFPFHAEANHCYRAYAYAAPTIKDLDLLIKDSTGAVAGEDSTDDPSPVVLEDGAVCFKTADDATVVVSIGAGSGSYGVQVWGD